MTCNGGRVPIDDHFLHMAAWHCLAWLCAIFAPSLFLYLADVVPGVGEALLPAWAVAQAGALALVWASVPGSRSFKNKEICPQGGNP
jgi:hypothetical protein